MPSFLSPWFLAGALTAVVPIVLHLLRREPEPRVRFPAVKLLKKAPVEYTEKRRLREWLLLALRVLSLVLLAVAFARPYILSSVSLGSVGVTLVALDTSYSLSAPGVFDRAKQLAKAAVNRAAPGDLVGVVTFADRPELAARPAVDRAIALAVIERASAGFGATRYAGALGAAVQAIEGRRGTIVVVTDLQEAGWDVAERVGVPESVRIEIADVGPTPPNLAVLSVRSDGDRIVASVRNAGDHARDARVHLTLDSRAAGDATVSVGPHASADLEFAGALETTDSIAAVTVDDRDGISADNVRYAVLDRTNRPAILLVTRTGDVAREAFYVQQALASGTAGQAYQVTGASAAQLSTIGAGALSSNAVIMLLSTRGLERRGREAIADYLKAGGGVLLALGPDIDGEIVGDVLGDNRTLRVTPRPDRGSADRALAPADGRHPLFVPLGANAAALGLVKFRTVAGVTGAGCQMAARFTTGEAALLDCTEDRGRALVLASDLDNRWNDFPLHAMFVPFVHESVRYLTKDRSRQSEYLVAAVPAGVPPTPGIATLSATPGAPPVRVAVNVDPRESDPARLSPEEFQAALTRLKDVGAGEARLEAGQREEHQHLWIYLLALMVVVLAAEGMIAGRTA